MVLSADPDTISVKVGGVRKTANTVKVKIEKHTFLVVLQAIYAVIVSWQIIFAFQSFQVPYFYFSVPTARYDLMVVKRQTQYGTYKIE